MLQEALISVEDHRRGPARRHDLKEMIVMAICAVLCGADGWVDVADWCEDEESWLKTFLVLKHGTPSHDTFGEVFRVLDATVFERCFRQWIASLIGVAEGVVAFDGKTVRGSTDGPNTALHMVSAYATALGVSLGQEGSAGKGNELAAIKGLLRTLVLNRHDGRSGVPDRRCREDCRAGRRLRSGRKGQPEEFIGGDH